MALTHGPPKHKYAFCCYKPSQCLAGMFAPVYRPVQTCLFLSACYMVSNIPNAWRHDHGLPTARAMANFFFFLNRENDNIYIIVCVMWHVTKDFLSVLFLFFWGGGERGAVFWDPTSRCVYAMTWIINVFMVQQGQQIQGQFNHYLFKKVVGVIPVFNGLIHFQRQTIWRFTLFCHILQNVSIYA